MQAALDHRLEPRQRLQAGLAQPLVPVHHPRLARAVDPGALTGTTSRSNRPSAQAAWARVWDRRPNASISARESPRRWAMRSAATYWFGMSMSHEAGRGEPASARAAVPSGTRLIASTPHAIPTPIASAAISPADQVRRLLRRTALGVQRLAARRIRQPGVQPRRPGDVAGLLARLRHAAARHLLDLGRLDARPVEQRRLHAAQDLGGVHARQHAAALADRGPHRLDDHRSTHGPPPESVV